MTLVATGVNSIPGIMGKLDGAIYPSAFTMNEAADHCGAVVPIPKTGVLLKIGIILDSVTNSDTLKVSLEGLDAVTGRPDGTVTPTNATGTVSSVTSYTQYWVPLNSGSGVSVTAGARTAITVRFDSYTAGNLRVITQLNGFNFVGRYPYGYTYDNTGAVWTFLAANINFAFEYSDGVVPIFNAFPAVHPTTVSWANNSNPDRRGLRFSYPVPFTMIGAYVNADVDGDSRLLLYDSDAVTLLEDVIIDTDVRAASSTGGIFVPFSTPRNIIKDTFYRCVLLPGSTTNNSFEVLNVVNDGAIEAMAGLDGGVNWHYTTCNGTPSNEASWTQTLTRRPSIALITSQLDNGVGSSNGGSLWGLIR